MKTNYADLLDKGEQSPGTGPKQAAMLGGKHTCSHMFVLTAVHGRLREPQKSVGCL